MRAEYRKISITITVISLTILSLLYMMSNKSDDYEITTKEITEEELEIEAIAVIEVEEVEDIDCVVVAQQIPIYVCGEVNRPDVYYLDETTIIKEAIMAAGGFTEAADQEVWNLAMEIQKGEKIYVPKIGEEIDKTSDSYDNRVGEVERCGELADTSVSIGDSPININKANAIELTSLPGIGTVIAQNIIDYRESNGEFKNVQDLTNVSRIGQKTLEKIKNYICLQ